MHRRKQCAYNIRLETQGMILTGTVSGKLEKKLTSWLNSHPRNGFGLLLKSLRKVSCGILELKEKGVFLSEDRQKAEILNKYFRSVFTTENLQTLF